MSVGSREDGPLFCRLPAVHTLSGWRFSAASQNIVLIYRNTAHGRTSFFLDFFFAVAFAAPAGECKPGLYRLLEVEITRGGVSIRATEGQGLAVQRLMN